MKYLHSPPVNDGQADHIRFKFFSVIISVTWSQRSYANPHQWDVPFSNLGHPCFNGCHGARVGSAQDRFFRSGATSWDAEGNDLARTGDLTDLRTRPAHGRLFGTEIMDERENDQDAEYAEAEEESPNNERSDGNLRSRAFAADLFYWPSLAATRGAAGRTASNSTLTFCSCADWACAPTRNSLISPIAAANAASSRVRRQTSNHLPQNQLQGSSQKISNQRGHVTVSVTRAKVIRRLLRLTAPH